MRSFCKVNLHCMHWKPLLISLIYIYGLIMKIKRRQGNCWEKGVWLFLCQGANNFNAKAAKKLCRGARGRQFVYFTVELKMTKAKSWFIAANADLQEQKGTSIYFLDILANKPSCWMIKQMAQWRRCMSRSEVSNILQGVRFALRVKTCQLLKSFILILPSLNIFQNFPVGPQFWHISEFDDKKCANETFNIWWQRA